MLCASYLSLAIVDVFLKALPFIKKLQILTWYDCQTQTMDIIMLRKINTTNKEEITMITIKLMKTSNLLKQ
jgi:hypothetical protein